jgi:hypothetical protein
MNTSSIMMRLFICTTPTTPKSNGKYDICGWSLCKVKDGTRSIKENEKSPKGEKAMGAISLSSISTLLQATHVKEELFNILQATMGE